MCLSAFPRNKAHVFLSSPTTSPLMKFLPKYNNPSSGHIFSCARNHESLAARRIDNIFPY